MMNKQISHYLKVGTVSIVGLVLAACAAGGGETGTGQTDDIINISSDQSVSTGVITGFGSVFINGIEYETSSATSFNVDGSTSTEGDLKVGMIVSLIGSVNADGSSGAAVSIEFEDNVEGLVLVNDTVANKRLDIMGQTVYVDNNTVFESNNAAIKLIEDLMQNNVVEVSGHSAGDGIIYATRIELKSNVRDATRDLEVTGLVSSLNSTASIFKLGELTVSYANADLKDFSGVEIANGDFIEVKSAQGFDGTSNQLIASKVELKKQFKAFHENSESRKVEIEGVITSVTSNTNITVNGRAVILTDETEYSQGDVSRLLEGAKLKLEGTVDQDGNVVAKELEFKTESRTKFEGLITAINAENKLITVSGQEIKITASTLVKDDLDESSDLDRKYFNFSDLVANVHFVEVYVYFDTNTNAYIATKLERDEQETDDDNSSGSDEEYNGEKWETEGIITAIDLGANMITIDQINIDISKLDNFDGAGALNREAEAKGYLSADNVWVATRVEIHSSEDND